MSFLMLVIVGVFVLHMILGYKAGFAKVAFSLVAWLIGLVSAYMLTPMVAEEIITKTQIPMMIESGIHERITSATGELNIEELEKLPDELKEIILGEGKSLEEFVKNEALEAIDFSGLISDVINLIALVLVLFGTRFALFVVEKLLAGVSKLPLIGRVNRMFGIVAGALKGLLWNWVILALVAIMTITGYNTTLIQNVYDSQLLTWLYQNNILLIFYNFIS